MNNEPDSTESTVESVGPEPVDDDAADQETTAEEENRDEEADFDEEEVRARVESALFVADEPLQASELSELLPVDGHETRAIMESIKEEYDEGTRGVQLIQVSGGFKMTTRERHYDFLKSLFGERTLPRLSDSAIEALVIIAYHQPIIRQELESIRGVNSQSVLETLLDQNFIRIAGRRDEIGRPIEYRTTEKFLDYFGLNTLNDLPDEEDINELLEDDTPS
jgi:segregation and condensation protein B